MVCNAVEAQLNVFHVLPSIPFQGDISFKPDRITMNESAGYVTITLEAEESVNEDYNFTVATVNRTAFRECSYTSG